MNVYDQIQNLDPGTEVTIALRGTVKDWGAGSHAFEVGGSHWLTASLKHAESITVHEPAIAWQIGDVVRGPYGITFVRDEDGGWRAPSGKSVPVTDKSAHTYTPVIREGEIVAQPEPEPDHPKVGDTLTEEQLTEPPGPWELGQDVTARLAAGETAPEGTILCNRNGLTWRTEPDGNGTLWIPSTRRWSSHIGAWSWTGDETKFGAGTGPIFVAAIKELS